MVTLELFDDVSKDGSINVDVVRNFLNANKTQDITFKIATLGGDLAQAITIHNLIKSHPKKTIAEIIGLTASAGTVIAVACDEITMSDNALFLIHNGWTSITGNSFDLQKRMSDLQKNDALMVKIYRERTGMPDAAIQQLMKSADWLSPTEALEYGFIDSILPTDQKIAASVSEAQRSLMPNILLTKLEMKMKNIFKKDAQVMNVLALKDGKTSLLINAEVPAAGVEIAPLGAATLEDGEFELADGRKITVAGGVITNVTEPAAAVPAATVEETTAEVIAAVGAILKAELDPIKAEFATLKATVSKHVPLKGTIPVPGAAPVLSVQSRVDAYTEKIREEIEKSRKA
jgi:ATP-dependent Clp protease protease subunit